MQHWPFNVIEADDGRPLVHVGRGWQSRTFFPEEIMWMMLGKMKEISMDYLNEPVIDAVVTVPAYYDDSDRNAIRDGKLYGSQ